MRVIRQVRPERVVTWSPERNWRRFRSSHPAHLATGEAALRAIYPDAGNRFALPHLLRDEGLEPWTVRVLLSNADGAELDPEVAATLGPLLTDPLAAGDAVAALRGYSLVSSAADGMVLVHRLGPDRHPHQIAVDLADRYRDAAAVLTEAAIPADTRLPSTWPVCAVLLPHVQAALADNSEGMQRMARYLGHCGDYATTRDLRKIATDACQRTLGAEHPDTLAAPP